MDALQVLRSGVHYYGEDFEEHYKYECYISKMLGNKKRQAKIDSFFAAV